MRRAEERGLGTGFNGRRACGERSRDICGSESDNNHVGKVGRGEDDHQGQLGIALAMQGQRVVVIDADVGLRNLDAMPASRIVSSPIWWT
jgi:hypothetical protein